MLTLLRLICASTLLLQAGTVMAQKQANIWYFGYEAGLDFNSGNPVALTDGKLRTDEGCASVADDSGRLLFYTDGVRVYNKIHQIMPNGSGLLGNNSSTQSSVVVPLPGSKTIYYIFTVDYLANANGMRYSVVDMTKDGGKGEVTVKNTALFSPACEKITAVIHRNEKDYWLISHKFNSADFVAYRLTATGLIMTPVISTVGSVNGGSVDNSRGYLKASPDGKRLALACDFCNFVEVFDFDNNTGSVSNPIKLDYTRPYGLEFSPNNQFLYISSWKQAGYIVQVDLRKTNSTDIMASEVVLASNSNVYGLNALQLGPDGRIYVATYKTYLNAITDPNLGGLACNYQTNYIDLKGKSVAFGLPTYIQSIFNLPTVTVKNLCYGDSTKFSLSHTSFDSIHWNFGDPSTGAANSSKKSSPAHRYSDTGSFTVRTIVYFGAAKDTAFTTLQIQSVYFSLGRDTTLCPGSDIIFKNEQPGSEWKWDDGNTDKTYKINKSGTYCASLSKGLCSFQDCINVTFISIKKPFLGRDTFLCRGTSITLLAPDLYADYLWQDGSTGKQLIVDTAGFYHVSIGIGSCRTGDSILINIRNAAKIYLGADTSICAPGEILLKSNKQNTGLLWSDNTKAKNLKVNKSGLYWLEADSNGCKTRDSILIQIIPAPDIELGNGFTVCEGDSLILNLAGKADTYLWHDMSNSPSIKIKNNIMIKITAVSGQCSSSDSAFAEFIDCNCFVYIPSAFTPQADGLNDGFSPSVNCPHTDYYFVVYNRWGEIVFESRDKNLRWDGSFNGAESGQDVYAWSLQFRYFMDRKVKYYQGTLQLLR